MKFVVDAQLSRRLAIWISNSGFDALHTLDLPQKNATPDDELIAFADREDRVVITKDEDFVNSYLLQGRPKKLLLISTGNISNLDLQSLLTPLLSSLIADFQHSSFIELTRSGYFIRG